VVESLNELMQSLGFAEYLAAGVGFRQILIAVEYKARANRKGVWNSSRELFRNEANSRSRGETIVKKDQVFER